MPLLNRKQFLGREISRFRDARLIIIATEGKDTEEQYFGSNLFNDSRIRLEIVPTNDNKSAPNHVLDRLKKHIRDNGLKLQKDDQLWLMVDTDKWGKNLSTTCAEAKKKAIHLAISNPCFEIWLYLHNSEPSPAWVYDMNCTTIENNLRQKLGSYNKSNLDIEKFRDFVDDAIVRAKKMDTESNNRWPQTPGTHVYKVVEEIKKIIQPNNK